MKQYIKDGKFYNGVIELYGKKISNPTEDMLKEAGYEEYTAPTPTKTLNDYKQEVISNIRAYDSSDNVNGFIVNGTSAWLDNNARTSYTASVNNAELLGETSIQLMLNNVLLTLPIDDAKKMLAQISRYADKCYIVTQQHINDVKAMTDQNDIVDYDYKAGYPEKLNFEL